MSVGRALKIRSKSGGKRLPTAGTALRLVDGHNSLSVLPVGRLLRLHRAVSVGWTERYNPQVTGFIGMGEDVSRIHPVVKQMTAIPNQQRIHIFIDSSGRLVSVLLMVFNCPLRRTVSVFRVVARGPLVRGYRAAILFSRVRISELSWALPAIAFLILRHADKTVL